MLVALRPQIWHVACLLSTCHSNPGNLLDMSHAPRIVKPQSEELTSDVVELAAALTSLPLEQRERIEPLFSRVLESTKRRRRILGLVQDALSQLRLDMKYLMFDLEATRRERDELRRKLEQA